jgi:hypothetical protein
MNIRLLIWLGASVVFGVLGWTGLIFCLDRLTVNFQDNSSPGGETVALTLASFLGALCFDGISARDMHCVGGESSRQQGPTPSTAG